MKHPNRTMAFLALALGALLIALGLLRMADGPEDYPDADASETALGSAPAIAPEHLDVAFSPAGERETIHQAPTAPGTSTQTYLTSRLVYASDRRPAGGASVGLWRIQTGEGPSFRPARRLVQLNANESGMARFMAPANTPLELYAHSNDRGPVARLLVAPLAQGESRTVTVTVERPPAPLSVIIRDGSSGIPVSGASIRTVIADPKNLGIEDFPGTTQLVRRTDADGRADLPGHVRNAHWLIVDAAGYSPLALEPSSLDGRPAIELTVQHAATLTVLVADAAGGPTANAEVRILVRLDGFATTFTGVTNSRGEASFRALPSGAALVTSVSTEGEDTVPFDAVTLAPLEKRTLELKLGE